MSGVQDADVQIALNVTKRVQIFFALTFCLNSLCAGERLTLSSPLLRQILSYASGMICWKIWSITSQTIPHMVGKSASTRMLYIVIESGMLNFSYNAVRIHVKLFFAAAIYCATLLALIITSAVGSNAFFLVFHTARQTCELQTS